MEVDSSLNFIDTHRYTSVFICVLILMLLDGITWDSEHYQNKDVLSEDVFSSYIECFLSSLDVIFPLHQKKFMYQMLMHPYFVNLVSKAMVLQVGPLEVIW